MGVGAAGAMTDLGASACFATGDSSGARSPVTNACRTASIHC